MKLLAVGARTSHLCFSLFSFHGLQLTPFVPKCVFIRQQQGQDITVETTGARQQLILFREGHLSGPLHPQNKKKNRGKSTCLCPNKWLL